MGKNEQIQYWIQSAEEDWETIKSLLKEKRLLPVLFFAHLTIEKLFKANWVKDNPEDFPPKVHNLEFLYDQINLELPEEWMDELRIINSWNIEGRYPDYRRKISKSITEKYVNEKLEFVSKLKECLINNLPSNK